MGGLGFSVWFDFQTQILSRRHFKKLRFHTKVVLALTITILSIGTLLTIITEWNNPDTIGNLPFGKNYWLVFSKLLPCGLLVLQVLTSQKRNQLPYLSIFFK